MARRRAKRRRYKKPLYYEWNPTYDYVHETMFPADKCQYGEYRSKMVKGTQIVICCPKGSRMDIKARCCKPIGKKACVGKPVTQSIRHKVSRFKSKYPDIWEKLQRAKTDKYGIRKVGP
jgi:hypothetical protein